MLGGVDISKKKLSQQAHQNSWKAILGYTSGPF